MLLAPRVAEVWGLEIVEPAVADAIANARLNEITGARFFAGDVRLAVARARRLSGPDAWPDVLVVDPPRAGLSQKIVRRIIEAAPRRIVYVSVQPDDARPRTPPSSWPRGIDSNGSGPSTCSRRRLTSNVWRRSSSPEHR